METTHKPGNLPCSDVRELLSDLIEVRSGEIPHPDGTRLSEPGMRAAVELHVAACEACRNELLTIEEVGAAFSDFSVGEPPAQHFANYGQRVRARMARTEPGVISGAYALRTTDAKPAAKRGRLLRFATFAVSTLAAACVALAVSTNFLNVKTPNKVAEAKAKSKSRVVLAAKAPPQMRVLVPGGAQTVSQEFIHNPAEPKLLQTLQDDEKRYGYFVFGEKTVGDDRPLLGAYLKTTRDVDHVVDEKLGLMVYFVTPGSPAAAMGLQPNDIIVNINDMPINDGGAKDAVQFLSKIREEGAGKPVTLQIVRPIGPQHLFMEKSGVLGEYEE
jgi:anti-sigma factor RsiW